MPDFQITSPQGQKYRVTAPEGATERDVLAKVQAHEQAAPQRGVMDQLLGIGGPRHQLPPERMVRGMISGIEDIPNIPEKMIKAAASAPPGSREATEAMVGPAAETAATFTGIGPASAFGNKLAQEGVKAGESLLTKSDKVVAPTADQLKAAYKADYDISKNSGVVFKPQSVSALKDHIFSTAEEAGHDEILSPKAYKVVEKLDGRTTVSEIDAVRKILGKLGGGPDPYEKRAAAHAIEKIDAFMKDVPNLEAARANFAAKSRAETIEKAVRAAERRAQGGGTGANINNTLRQEVRKIREKKSRGFTEDELATMDKIIAGTWTGDILRWLGKLAPTGAVSGAGGAGVGYIMGGPLGAVGAPIVGGIAKTISDHMTRSSINKLSEKTRMRSPLADKEKDIRAYLQNQGLQ